jgi:hypothetical protein
MPALVIVGCVVLGAVLAEALDRINPIHLPGDRHTPREKITDPSEGRP